MARTTGVEARASRIGGLLKFRAVDHEGEQVIAGQLDDEGRLELIIADVVDGVLIPRAAVRGETLCSIEPVVDEPWTVEDDDHEDDVLLLSAEAA